MTMRFSVAGFVLSILISVVYGGSQHDGAYLATGLDFGEYPLLNNNYTLLRSGGALLSRQIQGCQGDPTAIACGNSTVCCSQQYPTCVSRLMHNLAPVASLTSWQYSVSLKIGVVNRATIVAPNRHAVWIQTDVTQLGTAVRKQQKHVASQTSVFRALRLVAETHIVTLGFNA